MRDLERDLGHTLLQPVIGDDNLHLLCQEDEFDDLLGDLALHRLDAVVADQQVPANPNLKVYTHPLVQRLLDLHPTRSGGGG